MQFVDLVGWLASAVLIATLIRQIYKQWRSDQNQGVSRWLFIGQITASLLFILYGALVGNAVFIVSNALILATGITGYVLQRIKLKRLGDRA
ncbi:membrane protein [Xanthomonas campestris]|uniref:membrane protein n=1 Tax=Xanthomonas campestris TaxID=339 RepID=UPI000592687C|nr:membrane protein [Xanthomonas campestris]